MTVDSTSTVTAPRTEADRGGRMPTPRTAWRAPVLVGLFAAVVSVTLSWVPSVWYDEAATVVSATRSWAALGREVQHVDLVHATFYSFMHVWFDVVGYSPFTLRLPSAIAVGVAVGLTVVLGRILVGPRVGVLAGVFTALLPRVTWMGAEGRSFAFAMLLAVAATLLLVVAARRTGTSARAWPWWAAYVAVSALGGAVFLYLVLVILGHGVTVALPLVRRRTRTRAAVRVAVCWVGAAVLALAPLLPFARAASAQSAQIDWIRHISAHTVEEVLVTQFSYENTGFAVFMCTLAIAGALLALRTPRGRALLAVALPWVAVPTIGLILASLVTDPLYSPRYASFAAPTAALCMAVAVDAVPRRFARPASIVAVALAVALTAGSWVAQRTVTAKDDSAWNAVAALIRHERAREPAGTTDAVVFGPVQRHPKATSRIIAETYPGAFVGTRDPLLGTPAGSGDTLWETQRPLSEAGRAVSGADVVWLLTAVSPDERGTVSRSLAAAGYHPEHTWTIARTRVVRYTR
ncbi:glycosyltransferase family 39 protein [Curtobacterium sp. 22159]|uniref:glycosyltransferase family 39 protein n=1 Tax=Curtobacterium sp. 22159 TaxID=3453882 RepID=UPI003F86813B